MGPSSDSGTGETDEARAARLRDRDIEELAGMLQAAINNADLEARPGLRRPGGPEGVKGTAEEDTGEEGSDSVGPSAAGTAAEEDQGEQGEENEKGEREGEKEEKGWGVWGAGKGKLEAMVPLSRPPA